MDRPRRQEPFPARRSPGAYDALTPSKWSENGQIQRVLARELLGTDWSERVSFDPAGRRPACSPVYPQVPEEAELHPIAQPLVDRGPGLPSMQSGSLRSSIDARDRWPNSGPRIFPGVRVLRDRRVVGPPRSRRRGLAGGLPGEGMGRRCDPSRGPWFFCQSVQRTQVGPTITPRALLTSWRDNVSTRQVHCLGHAGRFRGRVRLDLRRAKAELQFAGSARRVSL